MEGSVDVLRLERNLAEECLSTKEEGFNRKEVVAGLVVIIVV